MIKVNFDGGFYNNLQASSGGAVIRNEKGLLMGEVCNWNRNVLSTEATEVFTMVQAIRCAQDMRFLKVIFEGDFMVVI